METALPRVTNSVPRISRACTDPYSPFAVDPRYHCEFTEQDPDKWSLNREFDAFNELGLIHSLAMQLSQHNYKPPFTKRTRYRRPYLDISGVGKNLVQHLSNTFPEIQEKFPNHELSPLIDALLEVARTTKLRINPDDIRFAQGQEIDQIIDDYNLLAKRMREAVLSNGMKAKVKSFRRNATRCYKQQMKVAEQGFQRHGKHLLIRLDWGSRKRFPNIPVERIGQAEFDQLARQVGRYRDEMVRHIKKTFKAELTFYSWKIEWGQIKGFHIHWLIALNGSQYQDRINVPMQIGKYWDEVICEGRSHTQNINAMGGAESSGLRVLHYSDPDVWVHIGRHADYLTKVDYTIKLRLPEGMRSFGCTKVKHTGNKPKPGPRRKHFATSLDIRTVRGAQGR